MINEPTGRHTNAIPKNIELILNCSDAELQAIENDKMLVKNRNKYQYPPYRDYNSQESNIPISPLIGKYMRLKIIPYLNFIVRISTEILQGIGCPSVYRVVVVSDCRNGLAMEELGLKNSISNLLEEQMDVLTTFNDEEKKCIEEDLKKKKKRPGIFEEVGLNPSSWLLIPRAAPVTRWQNGEDLLGEYVRLRTGGFIGKLARVASCASNGTTCSVMILKTDLNDKPRHTSMSSNNLEIINYDNLNDIEKYWIDYAKDKRIKQLEKAEYKKNQNLLKDSFALGGKKSLGNNLKRKRGRDGGRDGDGDGDEDSNDEDDEEDDDDFKSPDGDESRYVILNYFILLRPI